jgi:hypothetical protein
MEDFKIDKDKVIHIEPEYRVMGMVCKDKKHAEKLEKVGTVLTVIGVIGILGCVAMFGYINL